MTAYADLEISLRRRDADSYAVELRFSRPESDGELRLVQGVAYLDVNQLRALTLDAVAYGQQLSEILFADPAIRTEFIQARSVAQALEVALRLRLFIPPTAPELYSLRWETLRDPQDDGPLLIGEHILFSRYLSSRDWRAARRRPQGELSALVVIANPANLAQYGLAPIEVEGELARAKAGLGSIPVTVLVSRGSVTLNNLTAHLRGGYDILYLICHGAVIQGEPQLRLEDEAGNVTTVTGGELVTRLSELQQRPVLVVLASCQSAGSGEDASTGDEGALMGLGPRLAEVGVPAVVAMQGNITMRTVAEFMPVFFRELQRDGQIDRAMAVARGAVRERPDAWMPVLFMRLKDGRLWYVPRFAEDRRGRGLEKWPALLDNIREGSCTPILGPGLTESLLGSRREIALRWAETFRFPMAPHDREGLPQVAQYLAVNQERMFPQRELRKYLLQEMLRRYGHNLPDNVNSKPLDKLSLNELVSMVGTQRRAQDPAEPHQVLANLPFSIYITASPYNLLTDALIAAGKQPRIELCRWNEDTERLPPLHRDYRPSPQQPLVYHLFGHLDYRLSVVLTEDDYFDYLIGVTRNNDQIPLVVRRALTDTALLFLGFQMVDWSFRVLFRTIMNQEGREGRSNYAHVAVQIAPEEGRILEPEGAMRYLESYFQEARISVFWGSVEDFMQELQQRWQRGAG